MRSRRPFVIITVTASILIGSAGRARPALEPAMQAAMDRDLIEVTIPALQAVYVAKKYTVAQVTDWYLSRISRYNGVYRAVLHVDASGAKTTAAAEDNAARNGGASFTRGPLWGVPMVIKANTSVKGFVTSAGWSGFLIPGYELVAPADATIVAKLRAAGAVILGQTNMPDFAASDGNISSAYGRTGDAYDWRFSPGGSSGGTVTSIAANFALVGNGTDTANSIRMPAATSAVVGVLPTRGLVSIAGINPLDWLRDNTGPIARTVTDAAITLGVMAGEDSKDFQTKGSTKLAQSGPYTKYLKADALQGKRFGVPAFIVAAGGPGALDPSTREIFMQSLEGMRAAGATIVFDDALLPESFNALTNKVSTRPYIAEGMETFLRDFGPPQYHSSVEYAIAIGTPLPATVVPPLTPAQPGGPIPAPRPPVQQDPEATANIWEPQQRALAAYNDALDQFHLDGLVYPAIQMPPFDEVAMAADGRRSAGPHSNTGWVNRIGVPAISLPGGFYANGLPFGLEISTKRWKDGDLLGYAFAYEQATHHRHPPVLVEKR
ncbi:MAG TPA: amidase [Vicinamibacterales bacterium]|nr:amidase [Vicinamibacterales bacterium]